MGYRSRIKAIFATHKEWTLLNKEEQENFLDEYVNYWEPKGFSHSGEYKMLTEAMSTDSLHSLVLSSFMWDRTLQGEAYWKSVYRRLGGDFSEQ